MNQEMQVIFEKGMPEPFGATIVRGGVNFALEADPAEETVLLLYDLDKRLLTSFEVPSHMYYGKICAVFGKGLKPGQFLYRYQSGGEFVCDYFSTVVVGKEQFGEKPKELFFGTEKAVYSWGDDKAPRIPMNETIVYRLHVRGFTMQAAFEEARRGTFAGVQAKIPYLKQLGVTMVELMPAYEFLELPLPKKTKKSRYQRAVVTDQPVNYWGYTEGFPFAPKASYSVGKTTAAAARELKDLVRALHRNGMELSMEFYFPETVRQEVAIRCLRYWVEEYHIDGIRVNSCDCIVQSALTDPRLAGVKLFSWKWPVQGYPASSNVGFLHEDFMVAVRRFVKGDEGQAKFLADQMWNHGAHGFSARFLAKNDTFSLYDTVSYDRKHNEANGHSNEDGAYFNYSCNYGEEGQTKKKRILQMRKQQMKNMLTLLLLSPGIPVIEAGDERAKSKQGNNNPYCQDNEVNWMEWTRTGMAQELYSFTQMLIALRKSHPIFHKAGAYGESDHKGVGVPELSFHGANPWYPQFDHMARELAVLLNGAYEYKNEGLFYLAANMNQGSFEFGVPSPGKGQAWEVLFTTADAAGVQLDETGKALTIAEHSIVLLKTKKQESVPVKEEKEKETADERRSTEKEAGADSI